MKTIITVLVIVAAAVSGAVFMPNAGHYVFVTFSALVLLVLVGVVDQEVYSGILRHQSALAVRPVAPSNEEPTERID